MTYDTLTAACGGSINPDTLRTFAKAMREYEHFMAGLGALLAPVDDRTPQAGEDWGDWHARTHSRQALQARP